MPIGIKSVSTQTGSVNPKPKPSRNGLLIRWVAVIVLAIIASVVYFYSRPNAEMPNQDASTKGKIIRIGLSFDSVKIQRWADERDIMVEKAKSLGATVTTFSAEGDDDKQISQIENLISQQVDVIIVVAHDAQAVGPVLTKAQEAGIKVINYDRLTMKGKPDLYLSFDSVKVGEYAARYVVDDAMKAKSVPNIAYVGGSTTDNNSYLVLEGAMSVIDPLVKSGKITLVYNEFTKDWSPSEAYKNFKTFLANGGKVDGVVTAYDGLAYGVIQALGEKNLAGKVPVSGQNGELQAIQRIVQGTQTMTAWKPGKPLAEKAVEAAVAFATGNTPESNGTVKNDTADIRSYLFDPIPVVKGNIDETIIHSGTFTREQIYGSN